MRRAPPVLLKGECCGSWVMESEESRGGGFLTDKGCPRGTPRAYGQTLIVTQRQQAQDSGQLVRPLYRFVLSSSCLPHADSDYRTSPPVSPDRRSASPADRGRRVSGWCAA